MQGKHECSFAIMGNNAKKVGEQQQSQNELNMGMIHGKAKARNFISRLSFLYFRKETSLEDFMMDKVHGKKGVVKGYEDIDDSKAKWNASSSVTCKVDCANFVCPRDARNSRRPNTRRWGATRPGCQQLPRDGPMPPPNPWSVLRQLRAAE